jgi:hypothetical protein
LLAFEGAVGCLCRHYPELLKGPGWILAWFAAEPQQEPLQEIRIVPENEM